MLKRNVQGTVRHLLGDGNQPRWQLTRYKVEFLLRLPAQPASIAFLQVGWVGNHTIIDFPALSRQIEIQQLIREQAQRRRQQQQPQLQADGQKVAFYIFRFFSAEGQMLVNCPTR